MTKPICPAFAILLSILAVVACGDSSDGSSPEPVWGVIALEDTDRAAGRFEADLRAMPTFRTLGESNVFELYSYEAMSPGPLIDVDVGEEVVIDFTNNLTEPTTVHWHGLRISDLMDGSPRVQAPVQPGETFEYRFVPPDAGSYWYHPHVRANEQVEKGLYGAIIVRAADEPVFTRERFLLVDDIALDSNGDLMPFLGSHPELMHGRSGNSLMLNGAAPNTMVASARQGDSERWRIVNTANARTMNLVVEGATWRIIGTDGGLLAHPYEVDVLEVAVGQRYDLEVLYNDTQPVRLDARVRVLDNSGNIVDEDIALLTVAVEATGETASIPSYPIILVDTSRTAQQTVTLEFDAVTDPVTGVAWRINGQSHSMDPLFTFEQGSTVRMVLRNLMGPEHPFHLHGQFFEIDSRFEPGIKDTVLVGGIDTVEIVAYLDNPGRWMAHCHILEHAELGMMSEILVE